MNDGKEKLVQANELYKEGRAILDMYKEKELPKEKSKEVNKLFEEAEKLTESAESEIEVVSITKRADMLEARTNKPVNRLQNASVNEELDNDGALVKKAYSDYLSTGFISKELSTLRDTDGGVFVPEEMREQMIMKLDDILEIRQRATVIPTSSGRVSYPTFDFTGTVLDVAENATVTEESVTKAFGKRSFNVHKKRMLFKISKELVSDAVFDVGAFLVNRFSQRFAEELEDDFINGDGVEQSLGLLQAALPANDIITSAGSDIDLLSVIQAPMDLKKQYRNGAVYIMSRDQVAVARRLLDGDGRQLMQPAPTAGVPASLQGYPLIEVERMTAPAADGDASFIFGDLSHYWIVEKQGLLIERNDTLYMEEDQIGFFISMRFDGAPILGEAFVRYNIN